MSANRMHFLLPTKRITDIIQCWFARALCLYGKGIEISAFVFLSNHWHILCRDTKGTLAAFMWYFQGNVARAINNHHHPPSRHRLFRKRRSPHRQNR